MDGNENPNPARTSLWRNARLATLREELGPLGIIEDGVIAVRGERIVYAGPEAGLPSELARADQVFDCEGRWVTPALIDCHTHIVHGGNRAREFQLRLEGATYEEIARAGGGIASTVEATNALSVEALVEAALPRLDTLLAEGVSTVEVKSGYGLNVEAELKMLRAARRLESLRPVRIVTSYLAAHATPRRNFADATATTSPKSSCQASPQLTPKGSPTPSTASVKA
ncbi:imidazolonepropionase [Sinorhizobium meliloti]